MKKRLNLLVVLLSLVVQVFAINNEGKGLAISQEQTVAVGVTNVNTPNYLVEYCSILRPYEPLALEVKTEFENSEKQTLTKNNVLNADCYLRYLFLKNKHVLNFNLIEYPQKNSIKMNTEKALEIFIKTGAEKLFCNPKGEYFTQENLAKNSLEKGEKLTTIHRKDIVNLIMIDDLEDSDNSNDLQKLKDGDTDNLSAENLNAANELEQSSDTEDTGNDNPVTELEGNKSLSDESPHNQNKQNSKHKKRH